MGHVEYAEGFRNCTQCGATEHPKRTSQGIHGGSKWPMDGKARTKMTTDDHGDDEDAIPTMRYRALHLCVCFQLHEACVLDDIFSALSSMFPLTAMRHPGHEGRPRNLHVDNLSKVRIGILPF